MPRLISLTGCGGGAGATTLTLHLGQALATRGVPTRLVDKCQQGDLAAGWRRLIQGDPTLGHRLTCGDENIEDAEKDLVLLVDLPVRDPSVHKTNHELLQKCELAVFVVAMDYRGPSALKRHSALLERGQRFGIVFVCVHSGPFDHHREQIENVVDTMISEKQLQLRFSISVPHPYSTDSFDVTGLTMAITEN